MKTSWLYIRKSQLCRLREQETWSRLVYSGHSYRRPFFFQFFDIFFAQFFSLPYCPVFFPNNGMLTNLIFSVLENFTNGDRTPPYIDTYLLLFPNFWKLWKKHSPVRLNLGREWVRCTLNSVSRLPNFLLFSCTYMSSLFIFTTAVLHRKFHLPPIPSNLSGRPGGSSG